MFYVENIYFAVYSNSKEGGEDWIIFEMVGDEIIIPTSVTIVNSYVERSGGISSWLSGQTVKEFGIDKFTLWIGKDDRSEWKQLCRKIKWKEETQRVRLDTKQITQWFKKDKPRLVMLETKKSGGAPQRGTSY